MTTTPNTLYYGDNLDVLRQHVPDESVDLVYLDPPFNSNASYNVLFKERSGEESPAQIKAFTDTWDWTLESERTFEHEIILNPNTPSKVKDMITALRQFLGSNALMSYLVMMTPRLVELRRVLKPTGSIYLHCDPTASHYLKLLMDAVFGSERFLNEMTWKRSSAHSDTKQGMRRAGKIHDVLLVYTKSGDYVWNAQYTPYTEDYLLAEYRHVDAGGRHYKETDVTAAKPGGDTEYDWRVKRQIDKGRRWEPDLTDEYTSPLEGWEYKGVRPYSGRYWAYSKSNLAAFWKEGSLVHRETGMPRLMQFADDMPGIPLQDLWDDIPPALGNESLGYPTQKPQALLERIIQASSNEGDVVLDPFCGCGTAVAAAQGLKRRWIGIDVTHLAVALMKNRLKTGFGIVPGKDYDVVGEPVDVGGARALAEQDRHQFQYWAMSLLEAFPREQGKKGADKGVDGVVYFIDGPRRAPHKAIVQVKSGKVSSPLIRDLKGTVEREKAALGLFITLDEPTRDMRAEAVSAGFHHSDLWQRDYPKLQIRTIGDLLQGNQFELPMHPSMYQAAQRVRPAQGRQPGFEEAV